MARVRADRDRCAGYGNCVLAAPDLFDLDAQDLVVVLRDEVTADHLDEARRAVYDCPSDSLELEE